MHSLGTKRSCILILGQKNHATSQDKEKLGNPWGQKNHATSWGEKNMQPLGIPQPLGTKRIMQPLGTKNHATSRDTKKSHDLWDKKNHATSRDNQNHALNRSSCV